jgi:hypothetical protein
MKFGFNTPFSEQLDFFRQKLNLPSERWDDIQKAAHDRAFIVAGAMKADLVEDLREAVDKAIELGTGLEEFRRDFSKIVQKHGWTGWTGEGSAAGEAWRTRVIYQTNMATSYAAGRYRQLIDPDFVALFPFWRYVHNDGVMHPRPLHQHWGAIRLTLRHDHPFWKTHFPPNGWGCQCRVTPIDAPSEGDSTEPPSGWADRNDLGQLPGIDRGFDYAPGASVMKPLKEFIDEKLIRLDAPIGAAMFDAMRPLLTREMGAAVADLVEAAIATGQPAGEAALAHVVAPRTVADLAARGVPLESADVWLRDAELLHALRDAKTVRGATLPVDVWKDLPKHLSKATPYLDTKDTALIYAFDLPDGVGKVLVRVNYGEKARIQGKRTRFTSNFVRTGGMVKPADIQSGGQYIVLEK